MAKVFDCKFSWDASVTADIVKTKITLETNGAVSTMTLNGVVTHWDMSVAAMSSGKFSVVVTDSDGLDSLAQNINWHVGDGERPEPVTNLGFQVLQIRDVPDPEPTPPTP